MFQYIEAPIHSTSLILYMVMIYEVLTNDARLCILAHEFCSCKQDPTHYNTETGPVDWFLF
jgi:hypothetical protein